MTSPDTCRKVHLREQNVSEEEAKLKLYFFCDICGKSYTNKSSLKTHKLHVHEKYSEEVPCGESNIILKRYLDTNTMLFCYLLIVDLNENSKFGTIKLALIDYADVLNKNNMNKMRLLFRCVWDLIPDERIVKTTSGKGTQRVPKVCL